MTDTTETTTDTTAGDGAEGSSDAAPAIDGPSDEAMLTAARAALEGDGATADGQGDATADAGTEPGAETAAPPEAAAGDSEPEIIKLRRQRQEREKEQRQRETWQQEIEQRVSAHYAAEARQHIEREAAKIREQIAGEYRERVRKDLPGFLRETQDDPAAAVTRLVDAASPEATLKHALAQANARTEKVEQQLAQFLKRTEEQQQQAAKAQQEEAARAVRTTFLGRMDDKVVPVARAMWNDDEVFQRAQDAADDYCSVKGVATCPDAELRAYLEVEARRELPGRIKALEEQLTRLRSLQTAGPTVPGTAVAGKPAEPNKGQQAKPRTLSDQVASERRASPKPLGPEASDEERDAAALKAAREALGPRKASRMA